MIKNLKQFSLKFIIILIFLTLNNYAYSATQGSAGSSSSGTVDISISKVGSAHISDVEDANFGVWSGSGNLVNNDDICVYADSAGGTYNVTITGDGPSNSFQINDGEGHYMNYDVRWNDEAGTNTNGNNLTPGVILTGQTGANTTSINCNNGANLNSRMRIRILEADLMTAFATTYSGTVTIIVAAE